MKLNPLKTTLNKNGMVLTQLRRSKGAAIYVTYPAGFPNAKSYEVIIIRAHAGWKIGNSIVEPSEYYPANDDWGKFAWSYTSLISAEKHFYRIKDLEYKMPTEKDGIKVSDEPKPEREKSKKKTIDFHVVIPDGEFTMAKLATINGGNKSYIRGVMKRNGQFNEIKLVRKQNKGRGKPEYIYAKKESNELD